MACQEQPPLLLLLHPFQQELVACPGRALQAALLLLLPLLLPSLPSPVFHQAQGPWASPERFLLSSALRLMVPKLWPLPPLLLLLALALCHYVPGQAATYTRTLPLQLPSWVQRHPMTPLCW